MDEKKENQTADSSCGQSRESRDQRPQNLTAEDPNKIHHRTSKEAESDMSVFEAEAEGRTNESHCDNLLGRICRLPPE